MKAFAWGLALIFGLLLAAFSLRTPEVVPASAPLDQFSAARAFVDIKAIASEPHALGQASHEAAAQYLLGRLSTLGLKTERFDHLALSQPTSGFSGTSGTLAVSSPVSDLIGTLEGQDPKLAPVVLMAHYDSRINSPGAADDAAGVATVLEIVRAIRQGPALKRSLLVVLTDGEEEGLLGAEAFFAAHPAAKTLGYVLNFEARGDSGQTAMFETGPHNAGLITLYGQYAKHPSANSLAAYVYHKMPNGTDFTLSVDGGIEGLNFAFIGDELAYHTALSTPEHLNQGSVQHMGDQALGVVKALVLSEAQPKSTQNALYSDVLGLFFIHYDLTTAWFILGGVAALILSGLWAGRGSLSLKGLSASVLAYLGLILSLAFVLMALNHRFDGLDHGQKLPKFDWIFSSSVAVVIAYMTLWTGHLLKGSLRACLFIMLLALGIGTYIGFKDPLMLGLMALSLGLMGLSLCPIALQIKPLGGLMFELHWRHKATLKGDDLWAGVMITNLLLALALQLFLPEATPIFVWPLGLAALGFYLSHVHAKLSFDPPKAPMALVLVLTVLAIMGLAQAGNLGNFLFNDIGIDLLAIVCPLVLVTMPLLAPLLVWHHQVSRPWLLGSGLWAGLLAVLGLIYARGLEPTPQTPAPSAVVHFEDLDHDKAYRVASFKALDPWAQKALSEASPVISHAVLPQVDYYEAPRYFVQSPKAQDAQKPEILMTKDGQRVHLKFNSRPEDQILMVYLTPQTPLSGFGLNGQALKAQLKTGQTGRFVGYLPHQAQYDLSFEAKAKTQITLKVAVFSPQWPQSVSALPAFDPSHMAANYNGYRLSYMTQSFEVTP